MTEPRIDPYLLFLQKIEPHYPRPADPFETALWAKSLAAAFTELARIFETQHTAEIDKISIGHLTSDRYTLETPFTLHRIANVEKIRQNLPDIFEKVVFIRSCDAEKILGRRELYRLAKEAAPKRIRPLEQVNLTDLQNNLPKIELADYLTIIKKPQMPAIVPREETL